MLQTQILSLIFRNIEINEQQDSRRKICLEKEKKKEIINTDNCFFYPTHDTVPDT